MPWFHYGSGLVKFDLNTSSQGCIWVQYLNYLKDGRPHFWYWMWKYKPSYMHTLNAWEGYTSAEFTHANSQIIFEPRNLQPKDFWLDHNFGIHQAIVLYYLQENIQSVIEVIKYIYGEDHFQSGNVDRYNYTPNIKHVCWTHLHYQFIN